jgi:hypothetical protein
VFGFTIFTAADAEAGLEKKAIAVNPRYEMTIRKTGRCPAEAAED